MPRASNKPLKSVAAQLYLSAPSVWRRKALGMETVTLILCCSFSRRTGVHELTVKILFECRQLGCNRFYSFKSAGQSVCGLEPVAGDAKHGSLIRTYASLRKELARRSHGHAAGRLGKDAFAFRQESHAVHNLRIARVFGPAAAAKDRLGGIKAVRRIADRQRARDGRRLLRFNLIAPGLH